MAGIQGKLKIGEIIVITYKNSKARFRVTWVGDASTEGVQGRFDARGVSFDNAMVLARHYLQGFGWKPVK